MDLFMVIILLILLSTLYDRLTRGAAKNIFDKTIALGGQTPDNAKERKQVQTFA
jgi:hypothetical protein